MISNRWESFLLFLAEVYVLSLHSVHARCMIALASVFLAILLYYLGNGASAYGLTPLPDSKA